MNRLIEISLREEMKDLSLVPMKMCEGFDNGHPEWTLTGRETSNNAFDYGRIRSKEKDIFLPY